MLIAQDGADAEIEAARRANTMLDHGDRDGQPVWLNIKLAIVELRAPQEGKAH